MITKAIAIVMVQPLKSWKKEVWLGVFYMKLFLLTPKNSIVWQNPKIIGVNFFFLSFCFGEAIGVIFD